MSTIANQLDEIEGLLAEANHLLPQLLRQRGREHTKHHVGGAACRKRNNDAYGTHGIVLRRRAAGSCKSRAEQGQRHLPWCENHFNSF